MALFVLIVLIINCCFTCLLGSESNSNGMLVITPSTVTGHQLVGLYKVDDTLNLTCTFTNELNISNVLLDWILPSKPQNSQSRVQQVLDANTNSMNLIITNLQENDSGDYKCTASHNASPHFNSENSVRINVKNKKCSSDNMFQCSPGICIQKRYICDGFWDCKNGEDESANQCGPGNPCDNKLRCPDNRCIPHSWCCESYREPNCTVKIKHACCSHNEKTAADIDSDSGYPSERQPFNDMGFLQTTVYTVIGCAMAFMFIVTIIVIAICRVHMRRTLLSRCPAAGSRGIGNGRISNLHGAHLNGLPFYDLDLYLNRPGLNNDLMSVNPLLVTYNINNGVQFVGRPVDPPPYCEIVAAPPREGPPPPYASQENLCVRHVSEVEVEPKDCPEVNVEAESGESDALLGATSLQNNISVISCNAIDVVEDANSPEFTEIQDQPETGTSNLSSQCVGEDVVKTVSEPPKNEALDILVLKSCENCEETDSSGIYKDGESSSYVSSNVSDISKGAVKKIVGSKPFDGSSRRRSRGSPKAHLRKF